MRKNLRVLNSPFVASESSLKRRKRADEESKAPVSMERMRPECAGKVLESWKEEMNTKGPPRARKR